MSEFNVNLSLGEDNFGCEVEVAVHLATNWADAGVGAARDEKEFVELEYRYNFYISDVRKIIYDTAYRELTFSIFLLTIVYIFPE